MINHKPSKFRTYSMENSIFSQGKKKTALTSRHIFPVVSLDSVIVISDDISLGLFKLHSDIIEMFHGSHGNQCTYNLMCIHFYPIEYCIKVQSEMLIAYGIHNIPIFLS